MSFKHSEIKFMKTVELGRLATIQPNGTLQNSPVGFSYNEELGTVDILGYQMSRSQKFKNLITNDTVALVIDDIASRDPWRVRCLEIRGTGEPVARAEAAHEPDGDAIDTAIIRVTPTRIISFGIDASDTDPHRLTVDARDV